MPAITSVQVTKANNFFFNRLTQKISFLGLSQMEVVMTIYFSFSLTKLLVWVKCQWQPYFTHQYIHFFFHWNNCLTANFHTFGLIRKWTDLFTWMYLHRYICVSWLSFFFFCSKTISLFCSIFIYLALAASDMLQICITSFEEKEKFAAFLVCVIPLSLYYSRRPVDFASSV